MLLFAVVAILQSIFLLLEISVAVTVFVDSVFTIDHVTVIAPHEC